jgi:hypothetical protein
MLTVNARSSRPLIALLAFVSLLSGVEAAHAQARETFYRQQKTLSFGRIRLTNVAIYTVAVVTPSSDPSKIAVDDIDSLKLKAGTEVSIYKDATQSGDPLLTGTLASGTVDDPAGTMRGRFYWDGAKLNKVVLSQLRLRIREADVGSSVLGGTLEIPEDELVFLSNTSVLNAAHDTSTGHLRIVTPSATLGSGSLSWAELAIKTDFKVTGLSLDMDLQSESVTIENARFVVKGSIAGISSQDITEFVPDHHVDASSVQLKGINLSFVDGAAHISAESARIIAPKLTYTPYASLKVAGVSELRMTDLKLAECTSGQGNLLCKPPPRTDSVTLLPDPKAIIERLNRFGSIEPDDYLLPTGNSGLKYISLFALNSILLSNAVMSETKAATEPSISASHGSFLTTQSAVVRPMTEREELLFRAKITDIDPKVIELVVGFMPGTAFAKGGEKLAEIVGGMLFGSRLGVSVAASLKVSSMFFENGTALKPALAGAAFEFVYHSTASMKTLSGQLVDEYISKPAINKLLQLHKDLRELNQRYTVSALPSTLRYSQRMTEEVPWAAEQQARLAGTVKDQQKRSAEASALNEEANRRTQQAARQREAQVKKAVNDALNQPMIPSAPSSGNGTSPQSGTSGAGAGGQTSGGCNGVRPDGTVVICSTQPPYPDPDKMNKVVTPKP